MAEHTHRMDRGQQSRRTVARPGRFESSAPTLGEARHGEARLGLETYPNSVVAHDISVK